MKISAEARCPNRVYEESMTKKEIKARLAELGYEVTLRPRKSTLLALLEKAEVMEKAKEVCDPKKPEGLLDSFMGGVLLILTKIFIAIIALEFLNAATLDLPPGEFFGVIGVLFLLIGIPLRVWLWEREMK